MNDLKLIKRHYGEKMMHLCRELFPTLLETPGLLFKTLSSSYAYNKLLYDDIINDNYIEIFKDFIYSKADNERAKMEKTTKSPEELLDEAGYILYECKTEEDIQRFRKYYAQKEELCTFNGGRLEKCHVFFAVKKNVDEIKRENFIGKEDRQDEYGTSVISIQFSKGKNTLSIKNRYNHKVPNPDATFSNNLDNIIPGLTRSFEDKYELDINCTEASDDLDGYVLANDGRYYKYNYERNNIYYCTNNIIIDNSEVKYFDPSRYIIIEYFVLDMQEKTIKQYENWRKYEHGELYPDNDSFTNGLRDIASIEVKNNKEEGSKEVIINKDIIITLNKRNQIIKYKNHHLKEIGENFLANNRALEEIEIPEVIFIRDDFLYKNMKIKKIELPKVKAIGDCFIDQNKTLKEVYMPNVKVIGDRFLAGNLSLEELNLPEILEVGNDFLEANETLRIIFAPKVIRVGNYFLSANTKMKTIDLPELVFIGVNFMDQARILKKVNFPKLKYIPAYFLCDNVELEEIVLPEVTEICHAFIEANQKLKRIDIPKCRTIGGHFLLYNKELMKLDLPEVETMNGYCLKDNKKVVINAPKLVYCPANDDSRIGKIAAYNRALMTDNDTGDEPKTR